MLSFWNAGRAPAVKRFAISIAEGALFLFVVALIVGACLSWDAATTEAMAAEMEAADIETAAVWLRLAWGSLWFIIVINVLIAIRLAWGFLTGEIYSTFDDDDIHGM